MKRKIPISKQSFLLGLRCLKALHMKIHNPELAAGGKDNINEAAMAAGLEFEQTVINLIAPSGVDVTKSLSKLDFEAYADKTQALLKKSDATIYQATFISKDKERVMADIVRKKKNRIELIEVKAVMQLQDVHYYDAAYQYYCITNSGYKIDKVLIAHVNRDYVRKGDLTKELVALVDITRKVKQIQTKIRIRLEQFRKMLVKDQPECTIGFHCTDPYPCPFKEHCWGIALPENNVFEIRGFRMKEKVNLLYRGILSMRQAKESNVRFSGGQMVQVDSALTQKEVFEKEKIGAWLDQFKNEKGLYFLDFETVALATPQYNHSKPYEAVPFQYSIHYKSLNTSKLTHFEFLANPEATEDQRLELALKLLKVLNSKGAYCPIIAFNKRFESGRLKYLAETFPQLRSQINAIIKRLYDLADVFREKWYYHPDFKGSYSIKYILPVLCPELSYKALDVRNGGQASAEYIKLAKVGTCETTRTALLEYCKLDTLAMVKIMEKLQQKTKINYN